MIDPMEQMSLSRGSSNSGADLFAKAITSLSPSQLEQLVFDARTKSITGLSTDVGCVVDTLPKEGGSNIVYKATFSDGTTWAIRIPIPHEHSDEFPPQHWHRSMELDVSTQRFIYSRVPSIPIPRIHDWSSGTNNPIGRPYIITDYLPGTNLAKVWNDQSWISNSKREYIFAQLAGWMTELAAIEFPRIGRLDPVSPGQVVPFEPDPTQGFDEAYGPYNSAHAFISDLLRMKRKKEDNPTFAVLQLFLSALPDPTLDGPPFTLHHPDLDSQNILVADDGTVTGLIDWDNVCIGPQQGGAARYPSWITVDWDPLFYGWHPDHTPEENLPYDSPEELHAYREMYLAAIDKASSGKLTKSTRNSHVWTTLEIAAVNTYAASHIIYHLGKYVFGSSVLTYEVTRGIEVAAWYRTGYDQEGIAQVTGIFLTYACVSSVLLADCFFLSEPLGSEVGSEPSEGED